MSIGPIANLAAGYLQSIFSPGSSNTAASSTSTGASATSPTKPPNSQLSPFAQVLNTLQQLQQANPAQYQQVTQQIASNLESASKTAQANGFTGAAGDLNTLATDFTSASQNGQLPNVQDLAKAVGGGHHHHMHAAHGATANDETTSPAAASNPTQMMSQLLASFQTNTAQNAATDPSSIIFNTLSTAGI